LLALGLPRVLFKRFNPYAPTTVSLREPSLSILRKTLSSLSSKTQTLESQHFERYDHFAIYNFTAYNMLIPAWDCLRFPPFFAHSFLLLIFSGFHFSRFLPVLSSHAASLLKSLLYFLFSFPVEMAKRTRRVPELASPSNSASTSLSSTVPPLSSAPSPASFYKSLYRWAPTDLLGEKSTFTSLESIATYRKRQSCHPSRIFGKDHDKFVRMVACRVGEPVCADEASDLEGAFCFVYSTLFRRLGFRFPFTPFERTLLTELNIAPA